MSRIRPWDYLKKYPLIRFRDKIKIVALLPVINRVENVIA